ncbi:MAG: hypothetical protein PHE79_06835 [Eubacteriales bacterium]|nr:hypothetical protein [Eubacteriales bacterium]
MMAYPAIALNAAKKGISLWASSVLPALLPFFICANFMTVIGLPAYIGKIFEVPFQKLLGAPGLSAFVFSVSITSGYPMGAKLIGDFGRSKVITQKDAKRMLTFCSTSGPLFMLGAVGAGMLASPAAGTVIALSHYIGALLNGLLYRFFSVFDTRKTVKHIKKQTVSVNSKKSGDYKKINKTGTITYKMELPEGSLLDIFTDALLSSFRALGIICGYIVLFMLAVEFIEFSGILDSLRNEYSKGFIKGCLEMTIGCSSIGESEDLPMVYRCILCTFLISFGGLSIYAQSMSMLAGLKISSAYYLAVKLTHGLLAGLSAWIIAPFILEGIAVDTMAIEQHEIIGKLGAFSQLLFSTKMVIMIVIIFIFTILIDKLMRKIHESIRNHSGV